MKNFFRGLFIIMLVVPAFGCSHLLYFPTHQQHFDPTKGGIKPDEVWFENEEGGKLFGWYFHAKTKPPKGLLVFFHGNGENLSSHFATLLFVLDQGYDFFIFDYGGYGRSPGSPSPRATLLDGKAALKWAHNHRKGMPLVIFGQSLGGAVALRSASEVKGEVPIDLIVVDSTFHSYQAAGNRVMRKSWITWLFSPLAYLLLSDKYAPEDEISELTPIPLVVMHGNKDQTVDYELGKKVFELAHEPKEFWEVSGGTHTDAFWRHGTAYREKFLQRLAQLKSPAL